MLTVDSGSREINADEIAAGAVDATFGNYWPWDVLLGRTPASERVYWPIDEIGSPRFHSYLLGTQESLLARSPRLVRHFLAATEQGYLAAIGDPSLALAAFERYIPYFPREVLERLLGLISTTWTHEGRWGELRRDLLEPYAAWLARYAVLERPGVWEDAVTGAFLPGSVAA